MAPEVLFRGVSEVLQQRGWRARTEELGQVSYKLETGRSNSPCVGGENGPPGPTLLFSRMNRPASSDRFGGTIQLFSLLL